MEEDLADVHRNAIDATAEDVAILIERYGAAAVAAHRCVSTEPTARPSSAATSFPTSLLWRAAAAGNLAVVATLLDAGAPPGDHEGPHRVTPLYVAAQNGHFGVCRALLDGGAQADSRRDTGATPLFIATQNNHYGIASLLLDRGADVAARNSQDCTPLVLACSMGHTEIALLLLRSGASPFESAGGRRAVAWARSHGHAATRAAVEVFLADELLTRTALRRWVSWLEAKRTLKRHDDVVDAIDSTVSQHSLAPLPTHMYVPPLVVPSVIPAMVARDWNPPPSPALGIEPTTAVPRRKDEPASVPTPEQQRRPPADPSYLTPSKWNTAQKHSGTPSTATRRALQYAESIVESPPLRADLFDALMATGATRAVAAVTPSVARPTASAPRGAALFRSTPLSYTSADGAGKFRCYNAQRLADEQRKAELAALRRVGR
jgi:hypothetical protein